MARRRGPGHDLSGLFAEYAKGYRAHYQISDDDLARMFAHVSALSYKNGLSNPLAHFGKGGPADRLGLTEPQAILDLPKEGKGANRLIAPPLRLHDCSLVSDGAAALVLAPLEDAFAISDKVVEIAGMGSTTERLAESVRPNMHELSAGKLAVKNHLKRPVSPSRTWISPRCTTAFPSTRSCAPRPWAGRGRPGRLGIY